MKGSGSGSTNGPAGSRIGPIKALVERFGRGRSLGWLGPVLLIVLIAGLGMPERTSGFVAPASATHDEGGDVRHLVRPVAMAQRSGGDGSPAHGGQPPRIVSRCRSVSEAGLPQPRAPTAMRAS